jgi:hypothetical protein
VTEPLFTTDGDRFVPTDLTRTGWNDDTQHGGPPTALLMRAIEAVPTLAPMQVVRFTIDLLRPIPLAPLTVTTRITREGRNVQWSEALLCFDTVEIATMSVLRIRTTEVDLPPIPPAPPPAHRVDASPETWDADWGDDGHDGLIRFHRDAVEILSPANAFLSAGPGVAFARLLAPVVDDERPTPMVRLAALADLANGVSSQLDFDEFLFINADITVAIHRAPEGEWLGFDGRSHPSDLGFGIADTLLFDDSGPLGRILQAQLIDRHRSS